MNDSVALAIKVTSDVAGATSGLDETSSKLDSVRDAAKGTGAIAGQAAKALGGIAKGLDLVGAGGAADALKQAQQGFQAVKGAMAAVNLVTGLYSSLTATATGATVAKTVAEKASAVGTAVMTGAQWALNAALDANPVALIVIGIIALAAAIIIAYKRSETFRNIVHAAFAGISAVVGTVIAFIRDHWRALLIILAGPIGLAVVLIHDHFDKIQAAGAAVVGWVRDHFPAIKTAITQPFSDARSGISEIWDKITGTISAAKATISTTMAAVKSDVQAVVDVFQAVLDKIQSVIDKVKNLPHIDIPGLKTSADVGASRGSLSTGFGFPGKGGDTHIHVHLDGHTFVGDDLQLADKLTSVLVANRRRILGPILGTD